ncbi:DUF2088 domain-containing protein [Treponema parvum]|uniref:DUF2088 domain-containing protein n=1 Tax=Treponema parvum TaxID=138851 RepID=A0A975EXW3_9SPIR|nr:lactate racemase domain-containing protein [Treponema parvum]QTQ11000.1 DUF2088 domain-containing protein [Treponema parvum]QTQ17054.1 DUF2088 domain-containing protein [Treponema parvum]
MKFDAENRKIVSDLVKDTYLPKMFKIKQVFPRPRIEIKDIPQSVFNALDENGCGSKVKKGMRIAITVGSRGISNEALVVKSIVDWVIRQGADPFIVPAMGSHGGATAEGQVGILESYGVTQSYCGCPILSSMEVKKIGKTETGLDVFIDKYAAEADGIIVNCRIKPHTAFRGPYESGFMKMMAIGLGKQYGAEVCHEAGFKNMAKNVPLFGNAILKNAPVLFGLGVIENAYDETCSVIALDAKDIAEKEPEYLNQAKANMPRILVDECDVLVVDYLGKNFSGDGMDPNITGTFCTPYATGGIKSQRVAVLDLSEETHGNGIGLGYASATTQKVFDKLDLGSMYPNAITCTVLGGVRIPIIMATEKEAVQLCVKTCNEIDKKNPKIVRIPNSLHIEHIFLSESYYEDAKKNPQIVIESAPKPITFDAAGNILDEY